jgi:hypothetical protein
MRPHLEPSFFASRALRSEGCVRGRCGPSLQGACRPRVAPTAFRRWRHDEPCNVASHRINAFVCDRRRRGISIVFAPSAGVDKGSRRPSFIKTPASRDALDHRIFALHVAHSRGAGLCKKARTDVCNRRTYTRQATVIAIVMAACRRRSRQAFAQDREALGERRSGARQSGAEQRQIALAAEDARDSPRELRGRRHDGDVEADFRRRRAAGVGECVLANGLDLRSSDLVGLTARDTLAVNGGGEASAHFPAELRCRRFALEQRQSIDAAGRDRRERREHRTSSRIAQWKCERSAEGLYRERTVRRLRRNGRGGRRRCRHGRAGGHLRP